MANFEQAYCATPHSITRNPLHLLQLTWHARFVARVELSSNY